jgi:hypothetical protein
MIAIRRGVVFPFGCRYDAAAIIGRSKTRTRIAAARIRAAARREATAATFIADLSSHASVRRLATEVLARYPMSIRCERRRNSSILFRHAFVLLMALTACSFCARNKALLDGIRDLANTTGTALVACWTTVRLVVEQPGSRPAQTDQLRRVGPCECGIAGVPANIDAA